MKKTILLTLILLFSISVYGAVWVANPTLCPNNYQSQTCSGSDLVCGYSGGVTFCYNNALLTAPASITQTSTDQDGGSLNGGYIVDCTSYDGSSPYCDNGGNYYCDRNSSCYNVNRLTNCTASAFSTSVCSTCRSGYTYCDGSFVDGNGCEVQVGVTSCSAGLNNNINSTCGCVCDSGYLDCDSSGAGVGNGCEVQNGGSCTVGGLTGTYNGCTCVVSKSYFQTGTQTNYSTPSGIPFLWGWDWGSGDLLFLRNNATDRNFSVNASGCIKFNDATTMCTASSGSTYSADNYYLYLTSTVFNFNETRMNATVNALIGLNPRQFINSSYGNATYYSITNPNQFINTTSGNSTYCKLSGCNMTGSLNASNASFYVNVTRYPSGACVYDNATSIVFRKPCDI